MRFASILLLALASLQASAFVPQRPSPLSETATSTTRIFGQTKQPPEIPAPKSISYGEESRKYRRTVFSHDDWVRFRSPDRFIRNLQSMVTSGVYKNLDREVGATVAVATFVCVWNALTGGYQDFTGTAHEAVAPALSTLTLPLTPFTLSTSSLGLLLVFRTNAAYKRWDEARKNWGMNINHTRDLVRMGSAYYDRSAVSLKRQKEDLERLSLCTWAFVRAMKRHLSPQSEDEDFFRQELYERLPEAQAKAIIDAAHRPNRALQDLSAAIENLPMHFMRKNEIHKAVTIFEDNLGSSERLLTSPVPLFYSRHTARFLSFWLLLLPFALYDPFGNTWNHIGMIPAMAVISVFLFGIDELATQMDEPFTILPMQAFCDKIGNWCNEIVSWTPGDNGMPVYTNKKRRAPAKKASPASKTSQKETATTLKASSVAETSKKDATTSSEASSKDTSSSSKAEPSKKDTTSSSKAEPSKKETTSLSKAEPVAEPSHIDTTSSSKAEPSHKDTASSSKAEPGKKDAASSSKDPSVAEPVAATTSEKPRSKRQRLKKLLGSPPL